MGYIGIIILFFSFILLWSILKDDLPKILITNFVVIIYYYYIYFLYIYACISIFFFIFIVIVFRIIIMVFACNISKFVVKIMIVSTMYPFFFFLLLYIYIMLFLLLFFLCYCYQIYSCYLCTRIWREWSSFPQKVATVGFEGSHPFRCFSQSKQVWKPIKWARAYWLPTLLQLLWRKKKQDGPSKIPTIHVRKLSRDLTYSLLPSSRSLWVFGCCVWHPSFLLLSFWFPPFSCFFLWGVWRVLTSVLGLIGCYGSILVHFSTI